MAEKRSLEVLRKQYSKFETAKGSGGPRRGPGHGPGGPRARQMGMKGKPKSTRATIKRMIKYVGKYKFLFVVVLLCMLAPIINRISTEIIPGYQPNLSAMEKAADSVIEGFCDIGFVKDIFMGSTGTKVTLYVTSALILLACIYFVSIACTYAQSRIMLHISQNSVERIRKDLFDHMQTLPIRYFDRNSTGEVMSRYTNDVDNIDMMLNNSLYDYHQPVADLDYRCVCAGFDVQRRLYRQTQFKVLCRTTGGFGCR